jgi:hypothetical protein
VRRKFLLLISAACFVAAGALLVIRAAGDDNSGSGGSSGPAASRQIPLAPRGAASRPGAPRSHRVLKAIWAPLTQPGGASILPLLQKLHVDVLQVQLPWDSTAPRRPRDPANPRDPAYAWPRELDDAVRAAGRYGVQVAVMVKDSPGWANGGRASEWAPTRDADYAAFLTAAARHYPQVRRWMIWGEVNRGVDFLPMPLNSPAGPRRYATLLAAAYHALKAANRANIVVGGMTYTYGAVPPPSFVRWLKLPSGARPPLDEWGHNPYSRRRPTIGAPPSYPTARDMGDVGRFAAEVHRAYSSDPRFAKSGPQLWLSEFTVSSDRANRAFNFSVSRPQQALWLRSAFAVARSVPAVSGLGWFNLYDDPASQANGLTTGLLTSSGRPKPAFSAYRSVP